MSNERFPSLDAVIATGEPWMGIVRRGQLLRLIDMKGNPSLAATFFNAFDTDEHYSAQDTIRSQRRLQLTAGSQLMSNRGRPMLRIIEDTCGAHDLLSGACSAENHAVRMGPAHRHLPNCRDNLLRLIARQGKGLAKRDIASVVNFFTSVTVSANAGPELCASRSPPGRHVQLLALMDVQILLSNCSQAHLAHAPGTPTPVRVLTWDAA